MGGQQMRSVLIAAAGTVLLAAPAAGQTPQPEFKNFDEVTTCEAAGDLTNNGTQVATMRLFRGGLDADITVNAADSIFQQGPATITLCEAFAEQEITKLCQKNNRKGRTAQDYAVVFSFKKATEDFNPPPPQCSGPDDPHCLDSFTMAFRLDTFDAALTSGACADLL
jgi:hypothetical protein